MPDNQLNLTPNKYPVEIQPLFLLGVSTEVLDYLVNYFRINSYRVSPQLIKIRLLNPRWIYHMQNISIDNALDMSWARNTLNSSRLGVFPGSPEDIKRRNELNPLKNANVLTSHVEAIANYLSNIGTYSINQKVIHDQLFLKAVMDMKPNDEDQVAVIIAKLTKPEPSIKSASVSNVRAKSVASYYVRCNVCGCLNDCPNKYYQVFEALSNHYNIDHDYNEGSCEYCDYRIGTCGECDGCNRIERKLGFQ